MKRGKKYTIENFFKEFVDTMEIIDKKRND